MYVDVNVSVGVDVGRCLCECYDRMQSSSCCIVWYESFFHVFSQILIFFIIQIHHFILFAVYSGPYCHQCYCTIR